MDSLKDLVLEFEELMHQHHGQLNTEVSTEMQFKVDQLKQKIVEADAAEMRQLAAEALELLATLLSIVTNVMTLLN
jgi:hypothetical protein